MGKGNTETRSLAFKLLDAFLFSSLFLAICAVGMVYQTRVLFQLEASPNLLLFTFAGTLCSYNFHWYFTPASFGGTRKSRWSVRYRKVHAALFLIALLLAGYAAIQLIDFWPWLLVTAFITFLYSAPKIPHAAAVQLQRIAIGKTIFLAFAWAHVTALLPLLLAEKDDSNQAIFFVVNRFLLIYAICILFDYRDRETDRKEGIRSLLTQLETRGILILFKGIMAAFFISSFLLYYMGFSLWQVVSLSLPGGLVWLLYPLSLRHKGDYLFYLVLDGLMALSVPLVCFL